MTKIARRIATLGSENAFKLGANIAECVAEGMEVIRFNLGEPDFDTPKHIVAAAAASLERGDTHYGPAEGLESLREAVARHLERTRGIAADPARICITTGAKPPIGYAMQTYVDEGDEVIYPSPGFPIYESWIRYFGGTPVPLHLDDARGFSFAPDELANLLTPRTRLIFLNSPANPTGAVLSEDALRGVAEVVTALGRDDIRIYSDEVYEEILFDGATHVSIASMPGMQPLTVLVGGHSKSFAMTGWRLGYALLPSEEEFAIFRNLNINVVSCTPPFVQEAGREALESPRSRSAIHAMVQEFERRRDYAVPALNAIDGVTCTKPRGAFYVFPNIRGVCERLGVLDAYARLPREIREKSSPSRLVQMFLLYRYGVATMDRNSFGRIGADDQHFLRLSTATDLASIQRGIDLIDRAASDRDGFARFIDAGAHLY